MKSKCAARTLGHCWPPVQQLQLKSRKLSELLNTWNRTPSESGWEQPFHTDHIRLFLTVVGLHAVQLLALYLQNIVIVFFSSVVLIFRGLHLVCTRVTLSNSPFGYVPYPAKCVLRVRHDHTLNLGICKLLFSPHLSAPSMCITFRAVPQRSSNG